MAAIHRLLNPVPELESPRYHLPSPSPSVSTSPPTLASLSHVRKKQKICKDTAPFVKGCIHGECRYPAYETVSDKVTAKHRLHDLRPEGRVMDFARHVPYNSEKKSFLEKTHRDGFEVFHYEFKARGEEKVHTMMWDYNIGLVRTTPLFKCMGYSKTTPAKMLNRNPGLREICHSITGGALVAQGYWMPFEAARAIAKTFCWKIRYALTPVFGPDFPKQCLRPESEGFGAMIIDPAITQQCREQARLYREMEVKNGAANASLRSPLTPDSPNTPPRIRQLRRKGFQSPNASTNSYTTDSGTDDDYRSRSSSPSSIPYGNTWTPANTPRSTGSSRYNLLPSPRDIMAGFDRRRMEDRASSVTSSLSSTTSMLLKSRENSDLEHSSDTEEERRAASTRKASERLAHHVNLPEAAISDQKAAYLLLNLGKDPGEMFLTPGQKRRAST